MQNEPVSASFRTLIEKCLQRASVQQESPSQNSDTGISDKNSFPEDPRSNQIRTESNLEVIRSFLKN